MSEATKIKIGNANRGGTSWAKGTKQSKETISKRMISRYGYDTTQIEKKNDHKKNRWYLKKWADAVKEEQGCCQKCETTENLHAHHII
jgi:hypothetical protein